MPAVDPDGKPFALAGVDVLGERADRIIAAAKPILDWLDAREPGVVVRSISVRLRPEPMRVLISLEPVVNEGVALDPRPRALRFDPPYSDELRDAGREAERLIGEASLQALARRGLHRR